MFMKNILSVFLTIVIVLSIVAIPVVSASSITGGEVYTELYRMDFDDMEAMSDLTTDLTAFNNTYGRSAKLLSKKPEENGEKLLKYAIYEKTAGSSDKYIDIKQQNGNSRAAIQITLPDGGFKADNGTYKISFDVKINTETYKPFFRIKTNHLDDPMTDSATPNLPVSRARAMRSFTESESSSVAANARWMNASTSSSSCMSAFACFE